MLFSISIFGVLIRFWVDIAVTGCRAVQWRTCSLFHTLWRRIQVRNSFTPSQDINLGLVVVQSVVVVSGADQLAAGDFFDFLPLQLVLQLCDRFVCQCVGIWEQPLSNLLPHIVLPFWKIHGPKISFPRQWSRSSIFCSFAHLVFE